MLFFNDVLRNVVKPCGHRVMSVWAKKQTQITLISHLVCPFLSLHWLKRIETLNHLNKDVLVTISMRDEGLDKHSGDNVSMAFTSRYSYDANWIPLGFLKTTAAENKQTEETRTDGDVFGLLS